MDHAAIITRITEFRIGLSDLYDRVRVLRTRYILVRDSYREKGENADEFRDVSAQLVDLVMQFFSIPVPRLPLEDLLNAKRKIIFYGEDSRQIQEDEAFIRTFSEEYSRVNQMYDTLLQELRDESGSVDIDFSSLLSHPNNVYNYQNLKNHRISLETTSRYRNSQCELPGNRIIPDEIYNTLDRISYQNIIDDDLFYRQVACAVAEIIKRNKHSFLRAATFRDIPIENSSIKFDLVEHSVLSDTSVEGVVWDVGYHNPRPFATMKYSKVVPRALKSYNMVHELVVGIILNFLRSQTPNFMYVWGGFSCSIPTQGAPLPGAVLGAARLGGRVNYDHDFDTLCERNSPDSMEVIMLSESITSLASFGGILEAADIDGSPRRVRWVDILTMMFQIIASLSIAQSYCEFVHGDLHGGNVLVKRLPSEVDITYNISGTVYTIRTRYIPIIIDYGTSRLIYPGDVPGVDRATAAAEAAAAGLPYGTVLGPLYYGWDKVTDPMSTDIPENHQYRGVYMPLYDVARLLEGFSHPQFRTLDNLLKKGLGLQTVFGLRSIFERDHNPAIFSSLLSNTPLEVMALNLYTSLMDPDGIASAANRPPGFI